jgi:5'-nucleotidase
MDSIKNYLIDMDGVILRGTTLIPGAAEFLQHLRAQEIPFLILTNNSQYTARDLHVRLSYMGLDVPPEAIFTSALATAQFLHSQRPGGRAYAIGESGLTTALHDIGYILTDQEPEYVVLGETTAYSFERITRAIRFVTAGARFIATNSDVMGPGEGGIVPATGAVAALISAATGVQPYFVGKPNPLMMRTALRTIEAHSEESVMIGDRMDTDIVAGTESGLRTILVLTGMTKREEVERFPYRPTWIMESVADIKVSDLTSEGEDLNESTTRHLKVVGA